MKTLSKANRFNYQGGEIQSIEVTPQGGIRVKAAVCRAGILEYRNMDGTIRRELHLPEEIFSENSINTLNSATVTLMHPDEMVNSENYHMYSRGHVAENSTEPSKDSQLLLSTLVIQDAELVNKVLSKELTEISPGYICDVEFTSGVWESFEYDAIQRNIQYNHIAIGPQGWGRSGPEVSIRLDSIDSQSKTESTIIEESEVSIEEEIKVDSTEEEIIESSILFTDIPTVKASKITMKPQRPYIAKSSQISLLEAQYKELEAKFSAAQKRIDELEVVAEQATEQAKAEATLLADLKLTAEKFGIDLTGIDTSSAVELRKAVILEAIPGFEFPVHDSQEEVMDSVNSEEVVVEDEVREDALVEEEEVSTEQEVVNSESKDDSVYEEAYIQGAYDVAVAVLMTRQAAEVRVDSRYASVRSTTSTGKVREQTISEKLAETKRLADEAQNKARELAKKACK